MTAETVACRDRWVRTGEVARALRCHPGHVRALESLGRLPPAERVAGQRRWRWSEVEPFIDAHRRLKPRGQSTHQHHQLARRVRQDRSVLARAFFDCWGSCGLQTAVDACQRHGLNGTLRGVGLEQLARATAELEAASRLVRGLR